MSLNYKVRTRAYGLRDSLPFGKYKGQLVSDLIDHDPSYLLDCINEDNHFSLTAGALERVREAITDRQSHLLDCYNDYTE